MEKLKLYLITRERAIERTHNGLQYIAVRSPVFISKLEHLHSSNKYNLKFYANGNSKNATFEENLE